MFDENGGVGCKIHSRIVSIIWFKISKRDITTCMIRTLIKKKVLIRNNLNINKEQYIKYALLFSKQTTIVDTGTCFIE